MKFKNRKYIPSILNIAAILLIVYNCYNWRTLGGMGYYGESPLFAIILFSIIFFSGPILLIIDLLIQFIFRKIENSKRVVIVNGIEFVVFITILFSLLKFFFPWNSRIDSYTNNIPKALNNGLDPEIN